MTTNTGPLTGQSPASSAAPIAPTARWRFQRNDDGELQLLVWTQPDTDRYMVQPLCFPMREDEGHVFARGCDRVIALSMTAAHGTFTPVPGPESVAAQLGVTRYRIISPDVESHVGIVSATPYANWVEQATSGTAIRSLVLVFAGDVRNFLDTAQGYGAIIEPGDA